MGLAAGRKFTVHARRVRVPQICPPQAGYSSPRHGRASTKSGQVLSDNSLPELTSRTFSAGHQALPGPCQVNPPWQVCGTPWYGQRTGNETLQTFIEGGPAWCGPGELPGQQLLPGEETPWGKDSVTTPACSAPAWLARGASSRAGTQPGLRDGNHTQHFPVIQDIFSPPPQLCGGQRAALSLHPLHTQPHGSLSSEKQELPAL